MDFINKVMMTCTQGSVHKDTFYANKPGYKITYSSSSSGDVLFVVGSFQFLQNTYYITSVDGAETVVRDITDFSGIKFFRVTETEIV